MRIGIVNHGLLAAEAIGRVIERGGKHAVAWIAHDGAEAVARCQRDRPELVLMDLFLPRLDGVEATRQIMAHTPCAIIVVTAQVEAHAGKVFEAMGAGALDAVSLRRISAVPEGPVSQALRGAPAPGGRPGEGVLKVKNEKSKSTEVRISNDEFRIFDPAPLLAKIETISKLVGQPRSIREADPSAEARLRGKPTAKGKRAEAREQTSAHRPPPAGGLLVAIGASAGGPTALATILAALPANFPGAVAIVQHMDPQFAPGLTAWFRTRTKLTVRVAQEGNRLEPGTVFLAGRNRHLILSSPTQLGYTSHPADASYSPSVDVFFQSVARQWRGVVVGVLLSGMGRDGAEGLKTLRDLGHHTIAQDKNTSAVYGMPKAAVELAAAKDILALDKIGPRLTNISRLK